MGEGEARRFWVYEKDGMDVCAELRCSTVQYHHRLWLPSLASVLLFSTLSQPASQPASQLPRSPLWTQAGDCATMRACTSAGGVCEGTKNADADIPD
jgi:hypothetical protein